MSEPPSFRFPDLVSLRIRPGRVEVHQRNGADTLVFPARLLPALLPFVDGAPLESAFLHVDPAQGDQLAETFALLRELVAGGVLVGPDADPVPPVWAEWGASLDYYLDSRTSADHPYFRPDEQNRYLQERGTEGPRPSPFKDYGDAPFVACPDPVRPDPGPGDDDFVRVLLSRRTTRLFGPAPVTQRQLWKLLQLTWGAMHLVPDPWGGQVFVEKTSPSGGSLHSAEVYPLVMNVEGLPNGVYHYSVRRNGLEQLSEDDPRDWIGAACGGQDWVGQAGVAFAVTSVMERMAWKYRSPRVLRVVLHDVGHLSQTFSLVATWLGLGAFTTAALRDQILEERIGLDFSAEPVWLVNGAGVTL